MKRSVAAGFCCSVLVFLFLTMAYGAQGQDIVASGGGPSVSYPEKVYNFDPVFEGLDVLHDFVIQNMGTAPLDVKKVSGG